MNFEITCFEMGFKNCILKVSDIYSSGKYFFNQNISHDS